MQTQVLLRTGKPEEARYFPVPDAHLYTVLHQVDNPVARVLLVGPFASERHFGYHMWVRWARYLAANGVETLRYDYRGVGESTGVFESMRFEHWIEDVRLLAGWLTEQSPSTRVILHGMEMGAVLAAQAFNQGSGDGLLLWSPPKSANHVLRSTLLRWAGLEQVYEVPENRKTVSEYVRQLDDGLSVDVLGYQWTNEVWRDSTKFGIPASLDEDGGRPEGDTRPVKFVRFGKEGALLALPYPRYPEIKDLSDLYSSSLDWMAGTFALPVETCQ